MQFKPSNFKFNKEQFGELSIEKQDKSWYDCSLVLTTNIAAARVLPGDQLFNADDQSRAEAKFRFIVTELSKFKDSKESRLSPPCVVRNLPWYVISRQ